MPDRTAEHVSDVVSAARFERLVADCDGNGRSAECFPLIVQRYQEPHRLYHNLEHLAQCLREFDQVQNLANTPGTIELALWFHDVVYDPRRSDNEAKSAEFARDCLSHLEIEGGLVSRVEEFILMTRHQPGTFPPDAQLLLDIDLSVLGASDLEYARYSEAVRKEYQWVSDSAYREGRSRFLEAFLARETLFHTRDFQRRLEVRARRNIRREIAFLRTCAAG